MLPMASVLFCISGIMTGNEHGSNFDVLVASLSFCVTIIPSLNWSPRSPLAKVLFLVIIEYLIFPGTAMRR